MSTTLARTGLICSDTLVNSKRWKVDAKKYYLSTLVGGGLCSLCATEDNIGCVKSELAGEVSAEGW